MDDDLRTLHGVASIHSDSGYASTSSHRTGPPSMCPPPRRPPSLMVRLCSPAAQHQPGSHPGARHAPRPTATASLNARLDRLTRDMASLANSSPQTAGASLGITRKTITCHPTAASETSSRTPRVRRKRATDDGDKQDEGRSDQPPAKRRRSLPPRLTLKSLSASDDASAGHAARSEPAPVLLTRVRSPRSGVVRTITRPAAQPLTSVETGEGTMELPSFMLGQEARCCLCMSPRPSQADAWL